MFYTLGAIRNVLNPSYLKTNKLDLKWSFRTKNQSCLLQWFFKIKIRIKLWNALLLTAHASNSRLEKSNAFKIHWTQFRAINLNVLLIIFSLALFYYLHWIELTYLAEVQSCIKWYLTIFIYSQPSHSLLFSNVHIITHSLQLPLFTHVRFPLY